MGARASAIAETVPGLLLLALITLVAQSYGVRPSVLPLLAALLPFLAASIASGEPYLGLLRRLGSSPKRFLGVRLLIHGELRRWV